MMTRKNERRGRRCRKSRSMCATLGDDDDAAIYSSRLIALAGDWRRREETMPLLPRFLKERKRDNISQEARKVEHHRRLVIEHFLPSMAAGAYSAILLFACATPDNASFITL